MKIAFHLNCLEQGGAERVVSNLANQFAEDGDEVYILTEWKAENEFRISDKVKRVHVGLKPEDDKKGRITKFLLRILNPNLYYFLACKLLICSLLKPVTCMI